MNKFIVTIIIALTFCAVTITYAETNTYIGALNGCEMHQGVMSCWFTMGDTNFRINGATTNSKLMKKLYLKKDIGRNIKIVGTLEGNPDDEHKSIKARSIQFIK